MVDGNKLNTVLEFTYLGGTISSNVCIGDEIQRRMVKASASFGRLSQILWNNHHVSIRVKDIPCNCAVHPSIWTRGQDSLHTPAEQAASLHDTRSMFMRITWMDKVTNYDILERTGLPPMEDLLTRKNLWWTEHLRRMSSVRLPKQVLHS